MCDPVMIYNIKRCIVCIVSLLVLWTIIILGIYGAVQLWDRSDRMQQKQDYIYTITQQQQEIDKLKATKGDKNG